MADSTDQPQREIQFWECFIEWWPSRHSDPVPIRAYDALRYAQIRLELGDSKPLQTANQLRPAGYPKSHMTTLKIVDIANRRSG